MSPDRTGPPTVAEREGPKLNLGCGRDIRPQKEGWTNLDAVPLDGVDVVHDIVDLPYPFDDEAFEWVLASHVLEHIPPLLPAPAGPGPRKGSGPAEPAGPTEGAAPPRGTSAIHRDAFVAVVEELHRILAPGGVLHVKVPHYAREPYDYFHNPTHYRLISHRSFEGFLGMEGTCIIYLTDARFRSMQTRTNRRARLLGGRITAYHLRKYLGTDNLPFVSKPHEFEIWLTK